METPNETPNQIPFPRITLIKGLASLALHEIFRMTRPLASHGEHFITDAVDDESPGQ